jgi:hypothetical protein
MPQSKKEVEVVYFDRLKSAMPSFPDGIVEPTEEPDFLVRSPNNVLGIELTELHREAPQGVPPEQASEAMRHRVVARAQEIYAATDNPPVRVTVFMNDRIHIKKGEVESLASAISQIAIRNLPGQNSSREESYEWTNRAYFPEILHSVTVHRLDVLTRSFFSVPGATWVATLAPEDIERALQLKEAKYATYRLRCDSAWLVINADIGPMSTWFEFESEALEKPFRTSFDRVFVLRHFGNKLFELNLER